jgi:hypothetical protein
MPCRRPAVTLLEVTGGVTGVPTRRATLRPMRTEWLGAWLAGLLALGPAVAAERIEDRVVARADPSEAYALYVPDGASRSTPLLIVLDPRGRGRQILDFALPHARTRGWVVLSAYGSRSDTDEVFTGRALGALLQEIDRYPHDPRRVYLAGMSGTAKTLWVVAPKLRGRIAGLLGSGGGRPPELPALRAQDALPYFGYAGTTDFNHREMEGLDVALAALGTPHRLGFFEGPHGWPAHFGDAMAWFDLLAMRAGITPRDESWIDARFASCGQDADTAPDVLEQVRILDACVRDFDGLRDVRAWQAERLALTASGDYTRLQKLDRRLADDERRYVRRVDTWRARFGQRYVEGVEQAPPTLAESLRQLQIATLRKQAMHSEPRVAASARRRLAWIHAAAASYLPAQYAGDDARIAALKPIAEATRPP